MPALPAGRPVRGSAGPADATVQNGTFPTPFKFCDFRDAAQHPRCFQGKHQRRAQAGLRRPVLQDQLRAQDLGNGADDGQAQAGAGLVLARRSPPETHAGAGDVLGRHARAAVLHHQPCRPVPDLHPDRQVPALRAVADGVVHQIADRLPQQPVGRQHLDRSGRHIHAHVQLAGTGRRQQGADNGVRRLGQVDRLGREPTFGQGGVLARARASIWLVVRTALSSPPASPEGLYGPPGGLFRAGHRPSGSAKPTKACAIGARRRPGTDFAPSPGPQNGPCGGLWR